MIRIYLARRDINLSKTMVLKYMKELKIRSVVLRKKPRYNKGECYKKIHGAIDYMTPQQKEDEELKKVA